MCWTKWSQPIPKYTLNSMLLLLMLFLNYKHFCKQDLHFYASATVSV